MPELNALNSSGSVTYADFEFQSRMSTLLPEGVSTKSTPQFRSSNTEAEGISYFTAMPFFNAFSTSPDTEAVNSSTSEEGSNAAGFTSSRLNFFIRDLNASLLRTPDKAGRSLESAG